MNASVIDTNIATDVSNKLIAIQHLQYNLMKNSELKIFIKYKLYMQKLYKFSIA